MTNITPITLTDAAVTIVASDVRAFKADTKRYAAYVAEMGVTHETVADHVAMFRDAFKAAHTNRKGDLTVDGAAVKAYATKVRNGLNRNVAKPDADTVDPDLLALLVKAATKASESGIDVVAALTDAGLA